MMVINYLPDNYVDVNAMNFETMVRTIKALSNPDTQIRGTAGLQVNAFLAHAAVRMANHIRSEHVVTDHIDTVNM